MKKYIFFLLLAGILVTSGSVVSAKTPKPDPFAILDGNTPMDSSDGHQWGPRIHSNRVVWDDHRSGSWGDVYLFDIEKGISQMIVKSTVRSMKKPVIYGDTVAYTETVPKENFQNDLDIVLYNIKSHRSTVLTQPYDQSDPALFGDNLVYLGDNSDDRTTQIFIYNLRTKKFAQITHSPTHPTQPSIYNSLIVYTDSRNARSAGTDIYLYDLSTNTERLISNAACDQNSPQIFGDKIIWQDKRNTDCLGAYNGNADIYMYDLSSNQEVPIADTINAEFQPAIYGSKITYTSLDDVYLYDINTGETKAITSLPVTQWASSIYENIVVWMDYRGVAPNIYGIKLN